MVEIFNLWSPKPMSDQNFSKILKVQNLVIQKNILIKFLVYLLIKISPKKKLI